MAIASVFAYSAPGFCAKGSSWFGPKAPSSAVAQSSAPATAAPANPALSQDLLRRSQAKAAAGDFHAARSLATRAIAADNSNAAAYLQRASACLQLKYYYSAAKDARKALALGPRTPQAEGVLAEAEAGIRAKPKAAAQKPIPAPAPQPAAAAKAAAAPMTRNAPQSAAKPAPWALALLGLLVGAGLLYVVLVFWPARKSSVVRYGAIMDAAMPPPLPKLGSTLGGRFVLGRLTEESGGLAVYDGRNLSDESRTIVRYPRMEGALERAKKALPLRSPRIAALEGAVEHGGYIFAVYELVSGDSLRRLIDRLPDKRLSPEQAQRQLKLICEGLDSAHKAAIFHGPLCPENIFIVQGQAKIMGFGLWSASALAYAAPEFSAESGEASAASDLFSLGVCLYEMLTGTLPFWHPREKSEEEARAFPKASEKNQALPGGIDDFFAKALDPDPEKRFAGAVEMSQAFLHLFAPGTSSKSKA